MPDSQVNFYRWQDMPLEQVNERLGRRLVTGDRVMLAHVSLTKGCLVPRHTHEHEQITHVLEGTLRFWIGEDETETLDVSAGEVLHIPSHVPHKAEAMADTIVADVFCPPRQDWLDRTDDYLRR
jgi:quercetin dioxygenase-like cupin family protein